MHRQIICKQAIMHRGKFEPALGIQTSTPKITDVQTNKGYEHIKVLQTKKNMQKNKRRNERNKY